MKRFKLAGERKRKQKSLLNKMEENYLNKTLGWKEKNELLSRRIEKLFK